MGMVPPFLENPHEPNLESIATPASGLYWPLSLMVVALNIWFGFQLSQILSERHNLAVMYESQEPVMERVTRMRSNIDALADGTSRLSAGGNANAKRFIDVMAKRGITFNPPKDLVMKPEAPEKKVAP